MSYGSNLIQDPSNLSIGGAILGGLGGFLTGGPAGAIIGATYGGMGGKEAGAAFIPGGYVPPGGYTGATPGYNPGYGASCPPGYYQDSQGRCAAGGIGGSVQRILPGGQSGYLPVSRPGTPVPGVTGTVQRMLPGGASGYVELQPVQGYFGVGAQPYGRQSMTLSCPPGMVLGKDNVCYSRSSIRRGDRKHPPARRPLLSANDGKILEKAHGLESKLNRVAGRFLAPPRPTAKKKGRGRARKR